MNFPHAQDINKSTQASPNICVVSRFTSGLLVHLEIILVNDKTYGPFFPGKVTPWNCGGSESIPTVQATRWRSFRFVSAEV